MKRGGPEPEVLIRQINEEWEAWEIAPGGPRRLDPDAPLAQRGGRRIVALPARQAVALPLWIDGVETDLVIEAAKLELDLRGLVPKTQGMSGVGLKLRPSDARTLVIATVFPPEPPEGTPVATAERFAASPAFLPLAADSATLWREGADIVAAFTRGAELVYWETIDREVGVEEIKVWLGIIGLRLMGEGVLDQPPTVASLLEGSPAARLAPDGWPASNAATDVPAPVMDHVEFDWRPMSVVDAQVRRVRARQTRSVLVAVAGVYVVLAVAFALYFVVLNVRASRLATESKALNDEVAVFQPIAAEWPLIAPTAETGLYPLEILRNVVLSLPEKGIRLTLFDVEADRVTVEGEADNSVLASQYAQALEDAEGLKDIAWQSLPPTLKPSGVAGFHVDGTILRP